MLLNLDNWTYSEFNTFLKYMQEMDITGASKLARKVIVNWEYETSLDGVNPIKELTVVEGLKVLREIFKQANEAADKVDISEVELDLSNWKMKDFIDFQEAAVKSDLAKVEKMMEQVVVGIKLPLAFLEGVKATRALMDALANVLSGKD